MAGKRSHPWRVFEAGPEERLRPYWKRMTEPWPLRAQSKAEWIERRSELRPRLLRALGLSPMPDRLPLELHTSGTLQRPGYRIERVHWQTWPEVWASGWLYVPEGIERRAPAILNFHGDWAEEIFPAAVQRRLVEQARRGYIALAPDPIHLFDHTLGVTPIGLRTYQNLRALDLLAARPDVDRDRIGVVGEWEGAQQAMYLLAIDDRLRAAVLGGYVAYLQRMLLPEGHRCPCDHPIGIGAFTDVPEVCAMGSPRALLLLSCAEEWTAPVAEQELPELRALYRQWGQPDRLEHLRWPSQRGFVRAVSAAALAWFDRELRGRSAAEAPLPSETALAEAAAREETESEEERRAAGIESAETLRALDGSPEGNRGGDGIWEWYQRRVVAQPPQIEGKPARRSYQERVRAELRELLGAEPRRVALEAAQAPAPEPAPDGALLDQVSLRSEIDVRIPALWWPAGGEGRRPVLIALHPWGKRGALLSPVVRGLHAEGFSVLAPDVRLRGEMHRDWAVNCLVWGRPEAGMAVDDLRACVDWLVGREEVDWRAIGVLGEGDQGVVALLAAGLDPRIAAAIADCCDTTYRDGGEGLPVIPNILRVADVPQIASLVAPRPLWLYRVPEERTGFPSRRYYDWTRRTYQSLGEPEALKLGTGGLPDAVSLGEWLKRRLRRVAR